MGRENSICHGIEVAKTPILGEGCKLWGIKGACVVSEVWMGAEKSEEEL